ncbi:class II aldolase/adducin family protein [Maioricimonas sp. JC845]|uniref:class II aldolase/adducin family protein n=1 Tax=Maioricimonas sp. JC845 TaxID=3232138 RepID=UPI003457789B
MRRDESLVHPRDELMQTMERIYRYRMTTTSGGNLSIRDDEGDIWITPARIDKGRLQREDIVCVSPDDYVSGRHGPSSELPFHRAIYEARSDLKAVVHAHPVALVACSIARTIPDTRLFHRAWMVCGEVGFADYALPGSGQLGKNIAAVFARGANCVLLENHGVVVAGESLKEAFARFETLEFTAKTLVKAKILGNVRALSDKQIRLPLELIPEMPTCSPPPPSTLEKELRQSLCEFVRRGYRQRLMISTEGTFSARVDERSFLMTPAGIDRSQIRPSDLVLIHDGHAEDGKTPSRATRVHQAIYEQHPGVQAITNAYSVNASAFSVTSLPVESRTIPESYLFLRDVQHIPYGVQFHDPEQVAAIISPEQPSAILQNDGVLVVGTSVLDAFDRLEVFESTAEAIINARLLGDVAPMSDEVIDELVQAFSG